MGQVLLAQKRTLKCVVVNAVINIWVPKWHGIPLSIMSPCGIQEWLFPKSYHVMNVSHCDRHSGFYYYYY
jgi:hypothetical protein